VSVLTADDLYRRGVATLLAAWEAHARGARGASVRRHPGVAVAVFPSGPERAVYNNAVLDRDLDRVRRAGCTVPKLVRGSHGIWFRPPGDSH
jgi:hypothetical protein